MKHWAVKRRADVHVMAEQLAGFGAETRRRYQACLRKLSYPSEAEAHAVRERRQAVTDEVLRTYECPDCELWHLTSKPMTDAQVRELEDVLRLEIQRFDEARKHFRRMARLYLKFHVMVGRTPKDVDADFAQQFEVHERIFSLWLASHQRHHALRLAYATSPEDARRIDRRGREMLEEAVCMHQEDREAGLALYHIHRTAADEAMNLSFAMPSYSWRQHLRG
jgi:hypothetical protein